MSERFELRPLTEESEFTCDWGGCDEIAVCERATGDETTPWVSVCYRHSGRSAHRGKASRGVCSWCGREYALSGAGLVRAHDAGFAMRCEGVGKPPREARQ